MNNEKVQALFETMIVATDELKKATLVANQIANVNNNPNNIAKVIQDFKAIERNHDQLLKASQDSYQELVSHAKKVNAQLVKNTRSELDKIKKQSAFKSVITSIIAYTLAVIIGICVGGFGLNYYFSENFGMTINSNEVIFSKDSKARFSQENDGRVVLKKIVVQ